MPVFRGEFRSADGLSHPDLPLAQRPIIRVDLRFRERWWNLRLLIDTGADHTIIKSSDARAMLGDDYDRLDFQGPARVEMAGMSASSSGVVMETAIRLLDERGRYLVTPISLVIAEPLIGLHALEADWERMSLLGSDVLALFALHVDRRKDELYLELSEDAES